MDHEPADESDPSWLSHQIDAWRTHLRRGRSITTADADELEDHLHEQIDALSAAGLSEEESFLVAVRRVGAIDALTREFAREHSDRLWKQLVLSGDGRHGEDSAATVYGSRRMWVALALAIGAGIAIKLPSLFQINFDFENDQFFYPLNIGFLTLPFVVAYFAWERPLTRSVCAALAAAFGIAALAVNAFPFPALGTDPSDTQALTIIHLPIVLWLLVGVAYVGGRWRGSPRRMDFLRFTGELFIYMVLIALGGGVLIGLTVSLFMAIGVVMSTVIPNWIIPCGAAGALIIATWLVEAKQSVIENMAPVLARIFVPLFALALAAFVITMLLTGRGLAAAREILIILDLLLIVVFGLLLYSISARDPHAPAGILDWIQLALVAITLVVDLLALHAIGSRISDFGFTPNRLAALGMNLVLMLNLAGSLFLYLRFLRGRGTLTRLWGWQTTYLYVIGGWAAVVAFGFPVVFGFR